MTVRFPGSDATSQIASGTPEYDYTDGHTTGLTVSGSCTDNAGNTSGQKTYTVKYDATKPTVDGGTASRLPDANGWYNHALTVTFGGNDSLSGIGNCTETLTAAPTK